LLRSSIGKMDKHDVGYTGVARTLRELQALAQHLPFAELTPDLRFFAFFLSTYVQSVFADLLGDIPDDPEGTLASIREEYLQAVATGLDDLVENIEKRGETQPALYRLVDAYVSAVDKLNREDRRLEGRI